MSVQALSAVFAMNIDSPTVKLVLLALANYSDPDGRCWPSQRKLSEVTSLSERSIRGALDALERDGHITKTQRRRPDGSRATDIINLVFLQPEPAAGCVQPAATAGSATGNSCRNNRQAAPEQPAPRAALTTFEPSREPNSLTPRAAAERICQAMDAAGDALADMAVCPGIASIARLTALLKGDPPCDWESDIVPAITSAAAWHRSKGGQRSMRSWETAARIAVQNRDTRLAGSPAKTGSKLEIVRDDDFWRAALRNLEKDQDCWTARMGPRPGEKDCLVPKHILQEFETWRSAA